MPRRKSHACIAACLLLASIAPGVADPAPAIHYAPIENLEHIDVALIDRSEHEIDMAAYVLTDWPVMQALTRAADRGVAIRIYLDGSQLAEREPAKVFNDLAETPGVEIRIKRKTSAPMHLKSYQVDGRLLRTGAANFSASGLKRQDNDLIVIESAGAAAAFKRVFDSRFASGESCTLIMTSANGFTRRIHDRMPVLLAPRDCEAWLAGKAGVELVRPAPDDLLRMWPVSKRVNVSGQGDDDPSLIEPAEAIAGLDVQASTSEP